MKQFFRNLHPWPTTIIGFFALFISGVIAFVVFASQQRMDLVRPDYYAEELRFQPQPERIGRTAPVHSQMSVADDLARHSITVQLPPTHAGHALAGHIHFYRPSDARLDRSVPLAADARGWQSVDARPLLPGLWKVRISWRLEGHDYFYDQTIVVGSELSGRCGHGPTLPMGS